MSKSRDQEQFVEYRAWQWCKHDVLRRYIEPWSVIVGKGAPEVIAVDGCAGAGSYLDPDSGLEIAQGSPVIFARRAAAYTRKHGPGSTMSVICVERDAQNFAALEKNIGPFKTHVTLHHGGLAEYAPQIAERLGNAPALIFLDPIGVKSITVENWQPLLDRVGKTDLFITLHFAVVHRIGGMLRPDGTPNPTTKGSNANVLTVDRFFRGPGWREIAIDPLLVAEEHREEREQRYVKLYFDQVIGTRHRWKCAFPVRERMSAPVRYWLIQASDDWKPYMLMNDEIVNLTEKLIERDFPEDGCLEGFAEENKEAHRAHLRRGVEAATLRLLADAVGQALPFGAIKHSLVPRFYGQVKEGVYWAVVKALVKDDCLAREKRRGAGVDEQELISLPETSPAEPSGASVIPLRRAV